MKMQTKTITSTILCLLVARGVTFAAQAAPEGDLKPFLGEPKFEKQQVFSSDRFPTVVVAKDGSVLAVWNGVKVRRSEDGGATLRSTHNSNHYYWNSCVFVLVLVLGGS
jgi:hypothetical protein